ncbi:hypothetical protein [Candidatus Leptofilum sp.]|uniref:hypothetical protein n=1 Tax=Candidatus Leptofilum sp. TaxID=3241576 RepID=UPI003B5C7B7A
MNFKKFYIFNSHHKNFFAKLLTIICSVFILLLATPTSAHACTYEGPFYTLSQQTHDADVVFEGEVWHLDIRTSLSKTYARNGLAVYVLVDRYLKGDGPTIVRISGFGGGGGDCKSSARDGEHLVFFARTDESSILTANYLGPYSATAEPNEENLDIIMSSSGQTPIHKQLSQKDEMTIFLYNIRWWLRIALIIFGAICLKLIWRIVRRQKLSVS